MSTKFTLCTVAESIPDPLLATWGILTPAVVLNSSVVPAVIRIGLYSGLPAGWPVPIRKKRYLPAVIQADTRERVP